jgi:uncharacterized SAM-binding protein YcdF (DUF218 family)
MLGWRHRQRFKTLGSKGYKMLVLSNLMIFISFGLSYVWVLLRLVRQARRAPIQAPVDQILILGKMLRSGQVDEEFRERLERGAELYHRYGVSQLMILGGHTSPDGPSEAEAGRAVLSELKVPDKVVVCEEASRHTLENLCNARGLLVPDEKLIGLVSSRYHLARSKAMAEGLGLKVAPIAAETEPKAGKLSAILFEAYLYHWYLVGYSLTHRLRGQYSIGPFS